MKKRRDFIKCIAAGAAAVPVVGNAKQKRPNIILMMADDLGAEGLACYNSTIYYTPNLDKMAAEGMLFENAYATPLCTPTRVMVMTGQLPQKTGFRSLISKDPQDRMPVPLKTFGNYFKEAGYATAMAGKWQLGQFDSFPDQPVETGFDEYCMWKWFFDGKKTDRYYGAGIWQNGKSADLPETEYGPDHYSSFVLDFIERKKDQPFFIYYPMALVHSPFDIPPSLAKEAHSKLTADEGKSVKAYANMITYADMIVGRVNAKLKEIGQDENTLVIFTGDNGCPGQILSKMPGFEIKGGKGSMTEAGTRVPFIARWPRTVPAGVRSKKLISLVDMVPTFNAFAGINTAPEVAGKDLSHNFLGKSGPNRDHIFVCYGNGYFVRDKRWRLNEKGKLYDISSNSDKTRYAETLAENPEQQVRLQKLLDTYEMEKHPFVRRRGEKTAKGSGKKKKSKSGKKKKK